MQLLSGCPPAIYWAGSYLWDAGTHVVVCLASVAIFAAYGNDALAGSLQQAAGVLCLLLEYGLAVIPLAYCYSLAFASPSAAQVHHSFWFYCCLPATFCPMTIITSLEAVALCLLRNTFPYLLLSLAYSFNGDGNEHHLP